MDEDVVYERGRSYTSDTIAGVSKLELFAAVASVESLASGIQGLRIFWFVDSGGARAS